MPSPPPGPMSVLAQVAQSIESTAPAGLPELPTPAGLPELPAFPELFGSPEGGSGYPVETVTEETGAKTVEVGYPLES